MVTHEKMGVYADLSLANNLTHSAPHMPKQGFECNTMRGRIDLGIIFDNIRHGARGMDEASKLPLSLVL